MPEDRSEALVSDIMTFWKGAGPEKWFDKDAQFDATFHDRFRDAHFAAARRELEPWLEGAESSLALLLLLDQFPRNCFRGTAHMYVTDPLARFYTRDILRRGHDMVIDPELRIFVYLPLMHSEELEDQHLCCKLCEPLGERYMPFAIEHRDIIERFDRFPHRNEILLRESTEEERIFLEEGGFSG